ncbi:hypothetical protein Poly51_59020 [Rubripirellula tenax]|uniref:Uncharacterized protein n=1 Tax=Rubripirellula tenax TaxID=2528015 RepID=A0A5C6E4P8_9BACT|nr:hypothetical protein Poly51_59020 [Rubripirellula tenax]
MICVLFSALGFAYALREDAKRRELIAEIENAGGFVTFDDSTTSLFRTTRVSGVSIPYSSVSSVDTSRLNLFANLSDLSMTDGDVTTADGGQLHFRVLQHKLAPGDEPDGFFSRVKSVSTLPQSWDLYTPPSSGLGGSRGIHNDG